MKVALFADASVKAKFTSAPANVVYLPVLPDDLLQGEFSVRRWFIETEPDVTVILLPQLPVKTSAAFMLQLRGYTNVITSAVGFTKALYVLGAGTSLCRVLGELCQRLSADYGAHFVWYGRWYGDPVLAVEHVLEAEEANSPGPEGAIQSGEVPNEVVPQQGSGEQHGPESDPVLEVPLAPAQAASPGHVHAERASQSSAAEKGAVYHHACPIQGLVRQGALP